MKIKDIGKVVTGKTPSTKDSENFDGEINFITPEDIAKGYIVKTTNRHISEKGYNSIKANTLNGTSVLVGCIGSDMGNVAITEEKCASNQQINAITDIIETWNPFYVYYYLSMKKEYFYRLAGTTTTPILPKSVFEEINIPDIKRSLQDKIADILKTLDNKIVNNNNVNEELERVASILYDYWFLQFEFPNEEGKPYKSSGGKMVWNEELGREIPEGWECVQLKKIFSFVKGKIPEKLINERKEDLYPYITIDVANDEPPQFCSKENMIYCHGEVIMVMDGAASGDVYIGNEGVLGSTFAMMKRKRRDISNTLIYRILECQRIAYKKANTGSTVPHANRKFIETIKIPMGQDMTEFSNIFDEIYKKLIQNRKENRELTSLRDFLLPLLMNGQINFKD